MTVDGWTLTRHAIERAVQMQVDAAEILAVLRDPESDYPCVDDRYPGRRIRRRGRIAVAYSPSHAVVTVLWNRTDRWERTG